MTTCPSTELLNLTPHNIMIYPKNESDKCIVYMKSGSVARLNTEQQIQLEVLANGCPVYTPQNFTSIIPQSPPSHLFSDSMRGVIVSMPVAQWLCAQPDAFKIWREVYCADTGPSGAVRNEHGVIIGTKRLVRYISKN